MLQMSELINSQLQANPLPASLQSSGAQVLAGTGGIMLASSGDHDDRDVLSILCEDDDDLNIDAQ